MQVYLEKFVKDIPFDFDKWKHLLLNEIVPALFKEFARVEDLFNLDNTSPEEIKEYFEWSFDDTMYKEEIEGDFAIVVTGFSGQVSFPPKTGQWFKVERVVV